MVLPRNFFILISKKKTRSAGRTLLSLSKLLKLNGRSLPFYNGILLMIIKLISFHEITVSLKSNNAQWGNYENSLSLF